MMMMIIIRVVNYFGDSFVSKEESTRAPICRVESSDVHLIV